MKLFNLIVLLIFLGSCTTDSNETKPPINIAIETSWIGYIHVVIAQEKGFFAQHKVNVKLLTAKDGLDTAELYKTRQADGLLNVFPDSIMLNAEGYPTQVVMVIDSSFSADGIVSKPEIKTPQDLAGKTVAFEELNSFSHLFVMKLLEKGGLEEGQFKARTIVASEALEALGQGQVDAAYTYEPTLSQALKAGYHLLAKAGDMPGMITDVLAFHGTTIQQRPDDIKNIVAAILDARNYMQQHPKESLEIFAQFNQATAEEFETGFDGLHYPGLEENYLALQSDGLLFTSGQDIIDFYMAKGQIIQLPDLNTVVNKQFIQDLSKK
ncbi:ABC transporter substrate-binding protein [Candidatus Albibeggiatoa sp. nov. NOAA]|uniref:ABC transporter substrate-binding protein n=1 Tax=Candidatus Albibeggiatoa sp. nov. NOAA TaxID=3162724 RepID=UPI0032FCDA78|nr:ABC transporter substrate-binding protein [Thiotrichaceae bacterium]